MHRVGLSGAPFDGIADVVRWLGAVQSQDYGPAKWAIGHRVRGLRDSEVDRAFAEGIILRTHVLRPTWHFVLPEDIRWLLELTAPRVHAMNAYHYRRFELDQVVQKKFSRLIERTLRSEGQLTRKQIQEILEKGGIEAKSQRLAYIMMHAELEGLVCSGALSGNQHTYALLEERAPDARTLSRDQALAELIRRYFTSHGPATLNDMKWWSSLAVADIRGGLEMVGAELQNEVIDGLTFWFAEARRGRKSRSPTVHLLQPYDEYIVGYTESKYLLNLSSVGVPAGQQRSLFNGVVMLDGQVAGHWKRSLKKDGVIIEVALYAPFAESEMKALHAQVEAHGKFLGLKPVVRSTLV